MNKLMIAQVAYTKQQESGEFKRVKEQFLIPGDTYSTAEEFVFTKLTEGIKGEVILDSLKREDVEEIFVESDEELFEGWYKCKVGFQDPDSEKIKTIKNTYYVNAKSVASATSILEKELSYMADMNVQGVTISPIVDVHVN